MNQTLLSKAHATHFELKLNRPEKKNALNIALMTELTQTLLNFSQKITGQKYLVLSGEGSVFCAGADLNWMREVSGYSFKENQQDSERLFNLFYALYSFPLPVLCLVQGAAFGGGLGFLVSSDYVLVEEKNKFCFSEVKLGLSPAVISSFVLNRTNHPKLQALMLSGQTFYTKTALKIGLAQGLLEEKESLVKSLQESGQEALIETKALLRAQNPIDPKKFKKMTIKTISQLRLSAEAQKRIKGFLS